MTSILSRKFLTLHHHTTHTHNTHTTHTHPYMHYTLSYFPVVDIFPVDVVNLVAHLISGRSLLPVVESILTLSKANNYSCDIKSNLGLNGWINITGFLRCIPLECEMHLILLNICIHYYRNTTHASFSECLLYSIIELFALVAICT